MKHFFSLIKPVQAADDIIGTIQLPAGVPQELTQTTEIISVIIRFLVIVAGIFALWQLLSGGFSIITSGGDKGKMAEAQQKIQMAIVGLIVIAASFLIIAIISQILFGSFTAILLPEFEAVSGPSAPSLPRGPDGFL